MHACTREVLEVQEFFLLTCCWAGGSVNNGSHQVIQISEKSFLYQPFEHSGNASYWWRGVACVLQTPVLSIHIPSRNCLRKKGKVRAGILFSQSPSCHGFGINLNHAIAKIECLPKGPVCLSLSSVNSLYFPEGQSSGSEAGQQNRSCRWYLCKCKCQVVWPIARGKALHYRFN